MLTSSLEEPQIYHDEIKINDLRKQVEAMIQPHQKEIYSLRNDEL